MNWAGKHNWLISGAALLLGGLLALAAAQSDQVAGGVKVGGVEISGLSPQAALNALSSAAPKPPQVTVKATDQTWTVSAEQLGWSVDPQASLQPALDAADHRSLGDRLQAIWGKGESQSFPWIFKVDAAKAKATLSQLTAGLNGEPRNAQIAFDQKLRRYAVTQPDVTGKKVEVDAGVQAYLKDPQQTTLEVPVTQWPAKYPAEKLKALVDQGNQLMRPLTIKAQGSQHSGSLNALQVANLYWVKPEGIVLDDQAIERKVKVLAADLDQPAQNARFAWRAGVWGKVGEKPGRVIDRVAAVALLRQALTQPAQNEVTFPVQPSLPQLTLADLPRQDSLQLIAQGVSTYYGSSRERRSNVANAARKIDGAVIPTGATFSFLQTLGGIDAANGFVGGLIIQGGRTVDGLGGGVCQVSTTTFRAMYLAGLPVVERNQHSYRVHYYDPQVGFEAAVFDPGVDLRMKNDTAAPILLRTINNNARSTLTVQLWGLKPERSVRVSPAVILSRTPHPPAQYVDNPRLRPGTIKQVDWAADGYSLYITRTIQDAQGSRSERLNTVYKPWQAIYERGPQ